MFIYKYSLALLAAILLNVASFGQFTPAGISYQAIAREVGGAEIVNQNLTVRIGILENGPEGTLVYEEVHDVTTNEFGLFNLVIGLGVPSGNAPFNSLLDISWSVGSHFMKVEVDTPSSTGFEFLGTTELLSVPYAFHAAHADHAVEQDGDPHNESITDVNLNGTILSISEGPQEHSVDLAPLLPTDGDNDASNELITTGAATGTAINIEEGGQTVSIDASSIAYNTWQRGSNGVYNTADKVGIGTATPNSTLSVNGSVSFSVVTFASTNAATGVFDLDAGQCIVICDISLNSMEINLPSAAAAAGRRYELRKYFSQASNTNDLVLIPSGGDLIDGQNTYSLTATTAEYLVIVSNGTHWYVINHATE